MHVINKNAKKADLRNVESDRLITALLFCISFIVYVNILYSITNSIHIIVLVFVTYCSCKYSGRLVLALSTWKKRQLDFH